MVILRPGAQARRVCAAHQCATAAFVPEQLQSLHHRRFLCQAGRSRYDSHLQEPISVRLTYKAAALHYKQTGAAAPDPSATASGVRHPMPTLETQAQHGAAPHPQSTITVVYNGVPLPLPANLQAAVQALLAHAFTAFEIPGQPDLALFTQGNVPLNPNQSLNDQGIPDGATLVLRPRQVAAGYTIQSAWCR